MVETETPDGSINVIKVEEEIDGDQFGTRNYCFSKIGEPVPIKSDADFKFDMDSLPSRPLEVSERFGVIFVAHSTGFCVARIKDVMDAAEELKNGVNGSCILERSVVDIPLGKVSILALSADSSVLAASVGFNLYFFSVDGLLNKDHEPSFSKSVNGSSCIKDMQWSPHLKDQYVVLTRDGNLYRGAGQDDLYNLMDNVDAVNWSMNGKFLAVARYDYLSILSSKFEEKLRIKLLFDSLVDDDPDCVVKVDSVRWVRSDCIMLGCYTLSADGKEENNLIQLISVKDGKITNPSSSPVALIFRDAFLSINEDDIPSGSGPYTLMSYLDEYELAFVANKKSTDQHILVFNWSPDKEKGVEMIEILNDAWLPRIHLQVHDDADNMILGLTMNKVGKDEKTTLECGDVDTKVTPCCILMCLTIDGYFSMFHFASAIGPSALPENSSSVSDEEEEPPLISYQQPVTNIVNHEKQIEDQDLHNIQPQKAKVNEPRVTQQDVAVVKPNNSKDEGQSLFPRKKEGGFEAAPLKPFQPVNAASHLHDLQPQKPKVNEPSVTQQPDVPVVKPNNIRDEEQSFFSQKKVGSFEVAPFKASELVNPVNQEVVAVKSSPDSVSKSPNEKSNRTPFGASTEMSVNKASVGLQGSSGTFSSGSPFSSNVFGAQTFSSPGTFSSGGIFSLKTTDVKSPQLSPIAVLENRSETTVGTTNFSSGPQKFSFPKMTSGPSISSNLLPQRASTGAAVTESLPVVTNARPSLAKFPDFKFSDKGNIRNQTPSRLLNTELNLPEQRSVEEMAKELDALLDSIEGPGGFYDASVAAHNQSVAALEEGILVLSDRCRKWTDTVHQGIEEVQSLLDKTVQVLARKIYMEAIVKQATDSQYLDIWNRQKLGSELDMKRRHILEINQNLTNQLIELERHLNTLELQRFGDKSDAHINRRSVHMKHGPSRHIQSLHSLHNTMNAQLTAAEKLSESLSKQMAVLKIETEPVKKQNVKKELFDAIGISDGATTFSSPGQEKARGIPPKNQFLISSYSTAGNMDLKKSQLGALKNFEPETARRRRDSLDKSWASIEPPKTTVKRMLLQEDRQISPARLSLPTGSLKMNRRSPEHSVVSHDILNRPLNMSQSRGNQDVQIKRHSEKESSSTLWGNNHSEFLIPPVTSVPSLGLGFQSKPIVTRDSAKDSHDLTTENSRSRLTFTSKSDSVVVNDLKFRQQSQSLPEPSSNPARSPALNIYQKKPIESSESSGKNTDGNQRPIVAETSSNWSKKSLESPFSALLSASSSTAFSGKSFSLEASTRENQSSTASLSVPAALAPSSFSFKDTTSSSTSATGFGKSSTGFGFKLGATQTVPLSGSSAAFPSFPSTTTTASSSNKSSVNIESNTSKSEPPKLIPDTIGSSKPQVVSVPKFDLKPNENSSGKISPLQPVVSAPSGPSTSQPSTTSFSGSQLNLNAASTTSLVSTSNPVQPSMSPTVSSPVDGVGREIDSSDPAVTQEDEMEEEATDTTQLTLGNLGGFGLGSNPNPSAPKQNPFGAPFGNAPANTPITSFAASAPSGSLFRPASFNVESQQPSQPPQQSSFGAFSGGFGNNNQSSSGQGFGQPARIGSGQQALGSVLGSFGQSRQFGAGLPGGVASPSPFGGGFGSNQISGGFATAASSGGGFANLASGGGGFGGLATGGGGFAAAATGGGGFAAAATGSGGFGAAPPAGGGFAALAPGGGFGAASVAGGGFGGAASGGFGNFSSQGGSGFSTFGSAAGTGRPPSELFTQMRK